MMRGMDSLTLWIGKKPEFQWNYFCIDPLFGIPDDLGESRWVCHYSDVSTLTGKCIRKYFPDLGNVCWQAMLDTYVYQDEKTGDKYQPNFKIYEEVKNSYEYKKQGRIVGLYNRLNKYKSTDFAERIKWRAADIQGSKAVEKEGCRWWEWCHPIQINIDIM